jgi:hypothetical protein
MINMPRKQVCPKCNREAKRETKTIGGDSDGKEIC